MSSFSVPNSCLRQEIYTPAIFSASESSFALQKHMEVEKLDELNENIKILYLFIHYIHFIVIDNQIMKSRYELLFESHTTKSILYLKLQEIANKMSKIKGFKLFMKTIFQGAHEKRLSDEPYPIIAMFIKYYHDNYRLFKRIKDISILNTILNEVKKESYLWLTEEGRSTYPSYTTEVHKLYNDTKEVKYAPPPPSGIPASYILPPPPGPPPSYLRPNTGKRKQPRTRVTKKRRKTGKKSPKKITKHTTLKSGKRNR